MGSTVQTRDSDDESEAGVPVKDAGSARRTKKPSPLRNEARDRWIAKQRGKTPPRPFKDIYDELVKIGPRKKWHVPSSPEALGEALSRMFERDRKLEKQANPTK
jgi:hypothetical protein